MKTTFSVKNWNEFQHYKDRNPPWIKLHNHLLDDYEFECLGDAAKGHLLCIWMLASRTKNEMPYDEKWITKKIGASSRVNLKALRDAGFLEVEQDASNMLQGCEQDATVSIPSEEKRREETEESREDKKRFAKPSVQELNSYFLEKGINNILEAEKMFNYYESNGWQVGRNKMKDWKAAARNWISKLNPTTVNTPTPPRRFSQ